MFRVILYEEGCWLDCLTQVDFFYILNIHLFHPNEKCRVLKDYFLLTKAFVLSHNLFLFIEIGNDFFFGVNENVLYVIEKKFYNWIYFLTIAALLQDYLRNWPTNL